MRGRKRIISLVAVSLVMLVSSGVFASGFVEVPLSNILSLTGGEPTSDPLAVYPAYYFKDYTLQGVNSKFWVHINVSSVTDLFAWQLNITWNKAILNASRIMTGANFTYILYQTTSVNKTASFKLNNWVINATKNDKGYTGAADSILDNSVGAAGVTNSSWNRMASIEFKVVGYGSCDLVISTTGTGTLPTKLLDRYGVPMVFSATNGYFSNKLVGDIDGAGPPYTVDFYDFGLFAQAYLSSGPPAGSPTSTWNREADFNHDGYVDFYDFGLFAQNYLRTT